MFVGARLIRLIALLIVGSASFSCQENLLEGHFDVFVTMGGTPVQGAWVRAWWLDEGEGYFIEPGGKRSAVNSRALATPLSSGQTDEEGRVTLHLGSMYGTVLVEAENGTTREPGPGDGPGDGSDGMPDDSQDPVANDMILRAMVPLFNPDPERIQPITVSPLTTVAAHLGERRLARQDRELYHWRAMHQANTLLGKHFGDIDIVRIHPAALNPGDDLRSLGNAERHALALAALSSLARDIAEASGAASRAFGTLDLTKALVRDAMDDQGLLDGVGPEGPLTVGACSRPAGCAPDERERECNTLCDLDANTWRTDLAEALIFDYLPSERNRARLAYEDVRILAEGMVLDAEPDLFGGAPIERIQGPPPVLLVETVTMVDESLDRITHNPHGVPVHEPMGPPVQLGPETDICPTVYKHVHRLDDSADNPIRWVFTVIDQSGTGVQADKGEYRVRLRSARESEWLTDWLPATAIGSVERGIQYEVSLLRREVPELDGVQGEFEIAFRGADALGGSTGEIYRCWYHVPIAIPIAPDGGLREVMGAESIQSVGLHPVNNMAPMLNGVSIEQGKGLAELKLRNGTTEPVYVRIDYQQPSVTYTKSWRKTNALLFTDPTPAPDCIQTGDCMADWPPGFRTTIVEGDEGVIVDLIGGIRVWDITTGIPEEIFRCMGCDPGEYWLEPRISEDQPRIYRVMLVISELRELAPRIMDGPLELYGDIVIDPERVPVQMTGVRYDFVFTRCESSMNSMCLDSANYRPYRALTRSTLEIGPVRFSLWVRPTLDLPARPAVNFPIEWDGLSWEIQEPEDALPELFPELTDPLH